MHLTEGQRKVLIALCRPLKDSAYATPATNKDIAGRSSSPSTPSRRTCGCSSSASGSTTLPQNQKRARLAAMALVNGVVKQHEF